VVEKKSKPKSKAVETTKAEKARNRYITSRYGGRSLGTHEAARRPDPSYVRYD
jgi:hypothetical protein